VGCHSRPAHGRGDGGDLLLGGASDSTLGLIRSFTGGAVVGSLATEVFPKAFKESG